MRVETLTVFALLFIFNSDIRDEVKEVKIVKGKYNLFLDSYYMFSKHGSPSNNFYLALDITSPVTRTSELSYGYQRSTTTSFIQSTTISLGKGILLIGKEYEDQLGIYQTVIPKFSYIVTKKNEKDLAKNNLYAMAYRIGNTNHSITHQMKNYGLINHLSFSLSKMINDTGSIFFGGIPNKLVDELYKATIKVKGKKDANWDCSLSHVFIGGISYIYSNNYYSNRYSSYFTTKFQKIIVPNDFYSLFITIFKKAFEKKYCRTKYTGKYEIECDCKIITMFPSISFVIDSQAFRFSSKEYFKKADKKCKLMIINNTKGNDWIFGSQFISKYHTTFDYEQKEMQFYSSEVFKVVDLDILFPKKRLYKLTIILIFILLLGLLWKCLTLMWRRRTHKYGTKPIRASQQERNV